MRNEIAFNSIEDAMRVVEILLANDYVCMVSLEEQLVIVNYEWTECCDRNDVVFMSRYEFDDKYYEKDYEEDM